jgi:hypothetical protein
MPSIGPWGGFASYAATAGTIAWVYGAPGTYGLGVTVENASGLHDVALPSGAVPKAPVLVDVDGNVFFVVVLPARRSSKATSPRTPTASSVPVRST